MSLGSRIKQLRKEHNMSQTDLGNKIGVSKSNISMYEDEQRFPSYEKLLGLADCFNVSLDYLIGRTDERI